MRYPLLLGFLSLICATQAFGQVRTPEADPLWIAARACLANTDRLSCWRDVADRWPARHEALAPEQSHDPDADTPPFMEALIGEADAFSDAIGAAVGKLAAGVSPTAAVQDLRLLPVEDSPFVPNPLSDMTIAFGRLDAYAQLATIAETRKWPDAEAAVLTAWEADLPADSSAVATSGAVDLARLLARRGDHASVDRVLATLEPENAPEAVMTLIELDRLDAAAATAGRMTVEGREAGLRKEVVATIQRYRARVLPFMRAAMAAQVGAEFADQALSAEENMASDALAGEDLHARARDEVGEARTSLLRAADKAGRTDLATPLALALWEEPVRRDWTGANALITSIQYLVRPGAADGAARLVEAERRLQTRDRRLFPLGILYESWKRIGQPDQADALLDRWHAFAAQQSASSEATIGADLAAILIAQDKTTEAERLPGFNPLMLLQHDVAIGIGAARLEERLEGRDHAVQHSMLVDCGGAGHVDHFDMAETCLRRRMILSSPLAPMEQWSIAQRLIDLGTQRSRNGDRMRGEALIAEALAFSHSPPDGYIASDYALDIALESLTRPPVDQQEAPEDLMR